MPTFDYRFRVAASIERVAAFHRDARALPRLTPPPIFVKLHRVDPLANGASVDMTMWFGPVPVRWVALHDQVDARAGFRDSAVRSPLKSWRHTHTFTAIAPNVTEIHEHIDYAHHDGWRGLLARVPFNPIGLWFLFAYRRWVTQRALGAAA